MIKYECLAIIMLSVVALSIAVLPSTLALMITGITFIFLIYITYKKYISSNKVEIEYYMAILASITLGVSYFFVDKRFPLVLFFYFILRFILSFLYRDAKRSKDGYQKQQNVDNVVFNEQDRARLYQEIHQQCQSMIEDYKANLTAVQQKAYNNNLKRIEQELKKRLQHEENIDSKDEILVQHMDQVKAELVAMINANCSALDEKIHNNTENNYHASVSNEQLNLFQNKLQELDDKVEHLHGVVSSENLAQMISKACSKNGEEKLLQFEKIYQEINSSCLAKIDQYQINLSEQQKQLYTDNLDNMKKEISQSIQEQVSELAQNKQVEEKLQVSYDELVKKIDDNLRQLDSKIKNSQMHNKIVANSEIRELFENALYHASEELDIISPWLSQSVIDEIFLDRLERILSKGCTVKILYGIGNYDSVNGKKSDIRDKRSDELADNMRKRFRKFSRFSIKKGNTHQKLFICDDEFYVSSSFNILSFTGRYGEEDTDVRDESGEYSTDVANIKLYRNKYFNF